MSTIFRENALSSGRVGQKNRTRNQLLAAARALMAENESISVASVARRAGISTATAYRYFADPQELKLEAVIDIDASGKSNLIGRFDAISSSVSDPSERVIIANQLILDFVRENEPGLRLFIARFHERRATQAAAGDDIVPFGQRIALIERAIEPARGLFQDRYNQVRQALLAACGPEIYFILKDIAKLDEAQIERTMATNLRSVIRSHL